MVLTLVLEFALVAFRLTGIKGYIVRGSYKKSTTGSPRQIKALAERQSMPRTRQWNKAKQWSGLLLVRMLDNSKENKTVLGY